MAEKVVIGDCELWHGDCRDVLPLLAPVDAVVTDPPYGIALDNHGKNDGRRIEQAYTQPRLFDAPALAGAFEQEALL